MIKRGKGISWHGCLFRELDNFILNLGKFAYHIVEYFRTFSNNQESFFEITFTIIYFIEQFALFLYFIIKPDEKNITVVIGIFILILLTTKAFEKIFMQSRNKHLREQMIASDASNELERKKSKEQVDSLLTKHNELTDSYDGLLEEHEKLLGKYGKLAMECDKLEIKYSALKRRRENKKKE